MKKQLYESVAQQITALRKSKNLTQKQLSQLCKCQQSYISRVESGKSNISLDTLALILSALNAQIKIIIE